MFIDIDKLKEVHLIDLNHRIVARLKFYGKCAPMRLCWN